MARKRHPFQDTPQWRQQYESGLGYYGNGLGAVPGGDPLTEDEHGQPIRRYRMSQRTHHFPEPPEDKTVAEVLDSAGLTEKQRFVIELRHGIRGGIPLTHRQIAALMGVTHRAVQDLEKAARKKLAKTLAIEAL